MTRTPEESFDGLILEADWADMHGGGHHDDNCEVCRDIANVRTALETAAVSQPAVQSEVDLTDPTASAIMGAARLHTHDHTTALAITRDALATIGAAAQAAPKHDHRVYFGCECCEEHAPENGVNCREDIGVMPDGTWLCDGCYSDCDKTAYGLVANDIDDFVFPRFEDLPRPAPYGASPVPSASQSTPTVCEICGKREGTHDKQFDGFACDECKSQWTERVNASE